MTGLFIHTKRVVCGWPGGRLRMARRSSPDGQRRKVGAIGVSAGRGGPHGRLLDLVRGSSVSADYRRRWPLSRFSTKKGMRASGDGGRVRACTNALFQLL